MKLLGKKALEDYIKQGVYNELKEDIKIVEECSNQLVLTSLKNTYHSEQLGLLLKKVGFKEIIISDNDDDAIFMFIWNFRD